MTDLDGDGWIRCDLGHRHWGRFGAAGLLPYARDEAGQTRVLLQHRSLWSSHGGSWGLFGGARRSGEPPAAAALRETAEECTLPVDMLRVSGVMRDDHGGWTYHTVIGEMPRPAAVSPVSAETAAAAWVLAADVEHMDLHPGLAAFWPMLRGALAPLVIIVDVANVMGSRADGWWRDRAGAAARLRDEISVLARRGVRTLPTQMTAPPLEVWYPEIILVVEGAARALATPGKVRSQASRNAHGSGPRTGGAATAGAPDTDGAPGTGSLPGTGGTVTAAVQVVAAPRSGDDTIAELAARTRGICLVVTADRELRRRCEAAGAAVTGPRWLLSLL
jgi:8-oxo-dGTP diphosphatase